MVEKSGRIDRRRQNRPPEHGKIKPKEVRNPWGRAGKPSSDPFSSIDEIVLTEAERVIGEDNTGRSPSGAS